MFNKDHDVYDLTDQKQTSEQSSSSKKQTRHSICRFFLFIGSVISFARNFCANILFLGIVLLCFIAINLGDSIESSTEMIIGTDNTQNLPAKKSPILWLDLQGELVDEPLPDDKISQMIMNFSSDLGKMRTICVDDIVAALDAAAEDPEIKVVAADFSEIKLPSMQAILRITQACDEFKAKTQGKKPLVFFSKDFSQAAYAAASHGDEIVLDPLGEITIRGVSMNSLYYGPLLERFKLTPYVFKAGTHKSAVEPMLRDSMSPEVKAEYSVLATSLWKNLEHLIKSGRPALKDPLLPDPHLYIERLREVNGDEAKLALNYGLCDKLATFDEFKAELAAKYPSSQELSSQDKAIPDAIDLYDYLRFENVGQTLNSKKPGIAVIYGMGTISPYTENSRTFSDENFESLTDAICEDKRTKGVLIYLDSGGGEVKTSENIRRLIAKLHAKGLKTAVYMADMTASGAYWVATAAEHIYASPFTLTGSIGVFATSIGAHRLLNEYGVTQDGVATSPLAETAIAKEIDPLVKTKLELEIGNIYNHFINLVASSRKIDPKDQDKFAQGRVFTAEQAQKLGLIDEITSFKGALEKLEAECDLKDAVVRPYSVPMNSPMGLLPQFLLNKFGSVLPSGLVKMLLQELLHSHNNVDVDESISPKLMAVESTRAKL